MAAPANLELIHFKGGIAEFIHHLHFDGQAVTVPARHIRRIETSHRLVLDHKILEHLVYDVAHMYIAVGVWRAVVKDVQLSPFTRLSYPAVNIFFCPAFAKLRLFLHQIGLHRKNRLRQIQRVTVSFTFLVRHLRVLIN